MKIKDLGVDEFKALIEEVVEEKLEEMLGDPDRRLELKAEVKKRLERSLSSKARGIPVAKVAEELGLEW